MKEIFKTFISLLILIIISALVYLAWIVNKGGFSSQYLEKFINDRFKSENFYTSIKDPKITFDKKKIRIIIEYVMEVFSLDYQMDIYYVIKKMKKGKKRKKK